MPNPWFKFYGAEYLSDPKIKLLNAEERSCWLTLLCYAQLATEPGVVRHLTVETLLEEAGIHFDPYNTERWDACLGVLNKFVRMEMILLNSEDSSIQIRNWEKRQDMAQSNAERQKAWRKRQSTVTGVVTTVTIEKRREDKRREEKNTNTSSSTNVDVDVYDVPGFKEFWVMYPNKRGKGQALKTWKKLKPNQQLQARIMQSITDHLENDRQWKKDNGQFIPHPSTFLNARSFDDEITSSKITSTSDKF